MEFTISVRPDAALQHLIHQCRMIAADETFTLGGLRGIAEQVPFQLQKLLDSEAALMRLNDKQVELIRKERAALAALQAVHSVLRRQLETRDNEITHMEENAASELRGNAVLRDKFGAKPEETFPEFVTRLATERLAFQESLQLAQATSPSHQTLLDEIAKTGELLSKETTTNARLVSNLTAADFKIAEQARTLEHMDLRCRQELTRADNLENLLAVANHRAATAERALQHEASAREELRAEVGRQNDRANSAERGKLILRGQLRDMEQTLQQRITLHVQALERAEAAETKLVTATQRAEAAERRADRVEDLEAELRGHKDRPGLPIDVLVHEAYQTAKDKGWHDPADEDDVTVVETRQALCEEGIRSLMLCRIAEMLRKGKKPEVGDYLRLFGGHPYLLTAADTRLVSDLMLVITEVGEAIEDVVFGRLEEQVDEKGKPTRLPSELADIVIRVAHICGHRKIDLTGAILRKLKFNKTRPRKHGKHA